MRRRLPHARAVLAMLIVLAATVAAADAWTVAPPSGSTKTAITGAIVGYELAPVPLWPPALRGKLAFSAADRAALQADARRLMAQWATGAVLARWLDQDRPRALLDNRRTDHGRILIAARGRIAYYRFLRRVSGGRVVVRAAVEHILTSCRWGRHGALDVHAGALPTAVIMDYTLQPVDGTWKVAGVTGWRFLQISSGRITYDPPAGSAGAVP